MSGNGGKGSKLAKANESSTKSGQSVGKGSQSCPAKKAASLTVMVVTDTGKGKIKTKISIEVAGPGKHVGIGKQKKGTEFENLADGEYTVTATASGWVGVADKTITLKAGDKKSIVLKLKQVTITKVEPCSSKKPVKWFINQSSDSGEAQGRLVFVSATLSEKIKGVTVHFVLEPHKKNNKKLAPASLEASLGAAKATTNDEGVASTILTLSQYGGDKFRVSASLDSAKSGSKKTHLFVVWNRIFYEATYMKRSGGGDYGDTCDWSKVEAEYARNKVELVSIPSAKAPYHRAIAYKVRADWDSYVAPMRHAPADDAIRYLHFVLLDTIGYGTEIPQKHHYGVTKLKSSIALTSEEAFNESHWCSDVMIVQRTSSGWGSWESVPVASVSLSTTGPNGAHYKISYDLCNQRGLGPGPGLPAHVLELKVALYLIHHTVMAGLSWGSSSAVGLRWRERQLTGKRLKKSVAMTLIHEAGHSLGLAPYYKSDGTTRAKPSSYYLLKGSHCHEMANKCVMYGTAHLKCKFCGPCSDGLRARNYACLPLRGSDPN